MVKFVEASDPAFIAAAGVGAFKGAVVDLPNNAYHSLDKYWSSSDLKFLSQSSPAHFNEEYFTREAKTSPIDGAISINRVRRAREWNSTPEKTLGSLVHCLVLEPQSFEKEFFLMPELNNRTNEGKARKQELLMANPGKLAITDEMLVKANGMRSSIRANQEVMKLLEPGKKEASFFWTCPYSGLNFRAKLDHSSSKHFCELKTSYTAKPDEFDKIAHNLNYDLSLTHYREALRVSMGIEQSPAYFVVVEPEAPYVCQPYKVGDSIWETGHHKWVRAIDQLAAGMKTDKWPGYFPDVFGIPELNSPSWAVNKILKEIGQ